jgi:hypothetical protein
MIELELNDAQTKKFWNESCDAIGWDMLSLDEYLFSKYTITKRHWNTRKNLVLTIDDDQYATWLRLYL